MLKNAGFPEQQQREPQRWCHLFKPFLRAPTLVEDKRLGPTFIWGFCDGPREKANVTGPVLIYLDVDSVEETPHTRGPDGRCARDADNGSR